MLYVFGHQNPDTDAFCSAVAAAELLEYQGKQAKPVALWIPWNEASFVFKQANVPFPSIIDSLPEWSDIVLVDHNEASQSIQNRDSLEIHAVYDHHKVSNFKTKNPITMRVDPVWCTCTILFEEFTRYDFTPTKEVAVLMCGAIISDTLMLTSPTTTERDKDALHALAKIAEIDDLDERSKKMFEAKSDLTRMTDADIIKSDSKRFEYGNTSVLIAVIETTSPEFAFERKEWLLETAEKVKKQDRLDYLILCVVDVVNQQTTALVSSEDEEKLLHGAFGVTTENDEADLWNRVSRKKQLVPPINQFFAAK